MSYIIVNDGTDRASWLESRKTGVTATDVAKLAQGGAATRAGLLAEKLGKGRSWGGNAYTEHGKSREAFIASWVHGKFGIRPSTALLGAADDPRYLATPDGVGDEAGGEYKTTAKPWKLRSDVPAEYFDQSQWGMRVTGLSRWLFAWEEHEGFIPTHMDPQWFWIERDDERIAFLQDLADEFLAEVAAPYKPTEYDELIAEYLVRKSAVEEAQAELSETDTALRAMLADKPAARAVTPFGNLTWSTPKPRITFDSLAFKKADPDTYQQFIKESQAKPSLRITATKEHSDD